MTEDRAYTILTALRNIKLSISDEMNEQLKPWFEDIEKAIEDEQMGKQALSQEPYICDSCKHKDAEWDTEPCDGCCGNHSGYEPCTDAVSRQAVIDEIEKWIVIELQYTNATPRLIKRINELPSVTPTHKHVGSTQQNVGNALDMRCDDAVSREAVFNAIEQEDKWLLAAKGHNGLTEIAFSGLKGRIDALPPVTQKPETVTEFADRCRECGARYGKLLEQQPCDDAISREMALKECHDIVVDGERYRVIQEETLLGLPPVTPSCDKCAMNGSGSKYCDNCKQKSGKWITEEMGEGRKVYCSECKESADFEYVRDGDIYSSYGHGVVKKTKYCPNCGAKMVEPQEREDVDEMPWWIGKRCNDCGNEKCKSLGKLPKGHDCALWQPESEDKE